jgi:hypothetical protein
MTSDRGAPSRCTRRELLHDPALPKLFGSQHRKVFELYGAPAIVGMTGTACPHDPTRKRAERSKRGRQRSMRSGWAHR